MQNSKLNPGNNSFETLPKVWRECVIYIANFMVKKKQVKSLEYTRGIDYLRLSNGPTPRHFLMVKMIKKQMNFTGSPSKDISALSYVGSTIYCTWPTSLRKKNWRSLEVPLMFRTSQNLSEWFMQKFRIMGLDKPERITLENAFVYLNNVSSS